MIPAPSESLLNVDFSELEPAELCEIPMDWRDAPTSVARAIASLLMVVGFTMLDLRGCKRSTAERSTCDSVTNLVESCSSKNRALCSRVASTLPSR